MTNTLLTVPLLLIQIWTNQCPLVFATNDLNVSLHFCSTCGNLTNNQIVVGPAINPQVSIDESSCLSIIQVTQDGFPPTGWLSITSMVYTADNLTINFIEHPGLAAVVQTNSVADGPGFTDASPVISMSCNGPGYTNWTDIGAMTNQMKFYRVRPDY